MIEENILPTAYSVSAFINIYNNIDQYDGGSRMCNSLHLINYSIQWGVFQMVHSQRLLVLIVFGQLAKWSSVF